MSAIVLRGDAAHLPLPDGSVDLIVTSPPYFGQRDYRDGNVSMADQIGSEETPREYLEALWRCTAEWVRVLKPSGSLFVNLGDKYSQRTQTRRSSHQPGIFPGKFEEFSESWAERARKGAVRLPRQNVINDDGDYILEKSLMQLPQRYSIGCTDQLGLILRQDNIWSKTSGMPESVDDRCATRHEYIFHLVKRPRYFGAVDEIREPHQPQSIARSGRRYEAGDLFSVGTPNTLNPAQFCNPLGKLPGSVWEMATEPLLVPDRIAHARCCGGRKRPGCQDGLNHHAAFPTALPRKCILGWSPSGICVKCGEGRRPVSDRAKRQPNDRLSIATRARTSTARGTHVGSTLGYTAASAARRIVGYACACPDASAPTRPAVVLDPFGGTGTTALVADVFGRIGITVDRSMGYCDLATWRTTDPGERARALGVPKPPPVPEGQRSLFDDLEAS